MATGINVSKVVSYAVIKSPKGIDISKIIGYTVLGPLGSAPEETIRYSSWCFMGFRLGI